MQKADTLIRTKLRPPFTRSELVPRPRLQERMSEGLRRPLTLITAPAGFGKTTLVASCIVSCGLPAAWLSLDRDDNQVERFLSYVVAALQETDEAIGDEALKLLAATQPAPPEAVLTSLINDLDSSGREIALVLDDYQFIRSRAVHGAVAFLLEHCPNTLHLVMVTRSDPPLPNARLRARGQMVELRSADLRFTTDEAAQFLNEVMRLDLDPASVAALEERTEGWIAGLQMAGITVQALLAPQPALTMDDRVDVRGFIEGFSGTNRYILDYLMEEVLANQPPEIQHFLLHTSILERLTSALCDAIIERREWREESSNESQLSTIDSQSILDYLERANLFLVPLDDERTWYRYHHLFADLLRTQLQKSIDVQGVAQLHLRAAAWYEQNGLILEAIQHASMAADDEMVERLIEGHYMDMANRGEMSWVRYWMGNLSKDLILRRPWLCLYQALSYSWFGQLDEANRLLDEAEKRIQARVPTEDATPDTRAMLGYHTYVKSRVTAMQGDTRRAIQYCLTARENIPADNQALQNEASITLGFEYFLYGDFENANQALHEAIQSYYISGAINNPVAATCILARMQVYRGRLHEAHDLLQKAAQLIQGADGQYLGATGLVEVENAALLCEWNDTAAALGRMKRSLDLLPWWGKADDLCLAYTTLARIQLAQGMLGEAADTIDKAAQLIQTCGVFSEARSTVETTQVRFWLLQGDLPAASRWAASQDVRPNPDDRFGFEREPAHITLARVFLAQIKPGEAIGLLSRLEETARTNGRMGSVIEMMTLEALALQMMGDSAQADTILTNSLALAEPQGYVRVFLDEGEPLRVLLARWLAHANDGALRGYASHLLAQFDAEAHMVTKAQYKTTPAEAVSASSAQALVEPLSPRELEVLELIALGRTNREIAGKLIVSPGTVKAHTSSIYRKLDVANRTEAVARARRLGILL